MQKDEVPVKTAEGVAELSRRLRGLSQRHRTVLLLADGRRNLQQLLDLAAAAGVPPSVFDDLCALGLIETPGTAPSQRSDSQDSDHIDLPLIDVGKTLQPQRLAAPPGEPPRPVQGQAPPELSADQPLEEARELLLRALREQAPVTGSLTMMRLRRAASRAEIEALLDEVEQRLNKPLRRIVTTQTLRHVRHLLGLPQPRRA